MVLHAVLRRAGRAGSYFVSFALIAIMALSLGGCATSSWFSGGSSSSPHYFHTSQLMTIAPIIGAPGNIASRMTQLLISTGKSRGLTLVANGQKAPLTIRGYLVATKQQGGAVISYIWDITNSSGGRVNRVSGEQQITGTGANPWASVTTNDLQAIAAKTVAALAGVGPSNVAETSSAPPPPQPAAKSSSGWGIRGFFRRTFESPSSSSAPTQTGSTGSIAAPVYAMVMPVSGAPGDGRRSLTRALQQRLATNGIKIVVKPGSNVYTIRGTVTVRNARDRRQTVRIEWRVNSPAGRRLGTVAQQNTISRGALNGPWGAIADAAAGSAANGILKLLPKT